jgi:hypothetical protein
MERDGVMVLRSLVFALSGLVSLFPAAAHAYIGILYFRNLETGERNYLTYAEPGDRISINFDFQTVFDEHWVELSGFLDISGSTVVNPAVASTIIDYIDAHHDIPVKPYTTFTYGPAPIYNNKFNPGDATKEFLTDSGIYFGFNIDKTDPASQTGIYKIAEFVVPLTAVPGETLAWDRLNRIPPDDVSTRLIDQVGRPDAMQYNTLKIVPEPSVVAGLVIALCALVALRRRRR